MKNTQRSTLRPAALVCVLALGTVLAHTTKKTPAGTRAPGTPPNATEEAQTPRMTETERLEQAKTDLDVDGEKFKPEGAPPVNSALKEQPKGGAITGFDFSRDPLNAQSPMHTQGEILTAYNLGLQTNRNEQEKNELSDFPRCL